MQSKIKAAFDELLTIPENVFCFECGILARRIITYPYIRWQREPVGLCKQWYLPMWKVRHYTFQVWSQRFSYPFHYLR